MQLQKFWKNYEIYDLLKKEVVETNKYKIIQIKFKGIDDWNRPVYKVVDKNIYFGSTEKLFSHNDEKNKIDKFFKENIKLLEYFGRSFNCEPMGGIGKNKLEIVD